MSTEQEYDAHADMLDEDPSDHPAGAGSYTENFFQQPMPPNHHLSIGMQSQPPMPSMESMQPPPTSQMIDPHGLGAGAMNQGFDPFDPLLDADPFGLTASMRFPTQFTYQENVARKQGSSGV